MAGGTPISFSSFSMAATAAPRETLGAVSNEILAAGNWATWLICSGEVRSSTVAKAESGVGVPVPLVRYRPFRLAGEVTVLGSAWRITRSWLDWVKMVEMILWPKA